MISVLLPSRGRRERLISSYQSLVDSASGPFEFLVALDEDDVYPDLPEVWKVITTPRHGYKDLHLYYNELVKQATGDWLLLWNDDCVMSNKEWDKVIEAYSPNVILNPGTSFGANLCTFPIVPKRFVDAVGHFSLNAHNDTWWEVIAGELGIMVYEPDIFIRHERFDLTGLNNDQTYQEQEYQTDEFWSAEMTQARSADVAKLRQLLN